MERRTLAVEIGLMSSRRDPCRDATGPARYPAARFRGLHATRGAAWHPHRAAMPPSYISFGLLINKAAPFHRLTCPSCIDAVAAAHRLPTAPALRAVVPFRCV
ncbi:TPA: hypothetical protein ACYLN4_007107, partial [Burkholderia lata]